MNKRIKKKRLKNCGLFNHISADEKSFNPYEDFSAEEMAAVASMGKKLTDLSFDADDLSEAERSAFNKLTQRMYAEKDKFEDELIRKYLDDLHEKEKKEKE